MIKLFGINKPVYAILLLSIIYTINSKAQWNKLDAGTTNNLNDIFFINDTVGYVVGEAGIILKTTDGINWTSLASGYSENLKTIYFEGDTGIASGRSSSTSTKILKTYNGGQSWLATIPSGSINLHIQNAFYFNLNKILFTGDNTNPLSCTITCPLPIKRTQNNVDTLEDISWSSTGTGSPAPSGRSILFVNDTIGYVCGTKGRMAKTIDGGNTWTNISLAPSVIKKSNQSIFNDIFFFNPDTGFIVGQANLSSGSTLAVILKTNNGGLSWDIDTTSLGGFIPQKITFLNDTLGYAACKILNTGYGMIKKTINGGQSWTTEVFDNAGFFKDIWVINDSLIYVIGETGMIYVLGKKPIIASIKEPYDSLCTNTNQFLECTALATDSVKWFINDSLISSAITTTYNHNYPGSDSLQLIVYKTVNSVVYSDTLSRIIHIFNRPTAEFITDPDTICEHSVGHLLNSSTDGLNYNWQINNVIISTSENVKYFFENPGSYYIEFKVSIGQYCSNKSYDTIDVFPFGKSGACDTSIIDSNYLYTFNDNFFDNSTFVLAPNSFVNELNIHIYPKTYFAYPIKIFLTNLVGQVLIHHEIRSYNPKLTINTSRIPVGMYNVLFIDNANNSNIKKCFKVSE